MAKSPTANDNVKIGLLAGAILLIVGYLILSVVRRMSGGGPAPAAPTPVTSQIQRQDQSTQRTDVPMVSIFDPSVNPFRVAVNLDPTKERPQNSNSTSPTQRGSVGMTSDIDGTVPDFVNDGNPLAPAVVTVPPIRLSGVIVDENPAAYVVIDSKAELLSIGDLIPGGFRIISIDVDSIRVRRGDKTFRILIGQTFTGDPTPHPKPVDSGLPGIEAPPH